MGATDFKRGPLPPRWWRYRTGIRIQPTRICGARSLLLAHVGNLNLFDVIRLANRLKYCESIDKVIFTDIQMLTFDLLRRQRDGRSRVCIFTNIFRYYIVVSQQARRYLVCVGSVSENVRAVLSRPDSWAVLPLSSHAFKTHAGVMCWKLDGRPTAVRPLGFGDLSPKPRTYWP